MLTHRNSKSIITFISQVLARTVDTGLSIPSLRDPKIRGLCYDHFADLVVVPVSGDDPRPQKRARLSAHTRENSTISARVHVINNINSLLGTRKSTEITGLSQIAMYVMEY